MASLRRALTIAPRLRPVPTTTTVRPVLLTQRPASSLSSQSRPATDRKSAAAAEEASEDLDALNDPGMNGNFPDPSQTSALPLKRSLRDPYGPGDGTRWWDPVERRNYGEPVHEDNDILGVFSTEEYTHFTPGWGGVLMVSSPILSSSERHDTIWFTRWMLIRCSPDRAASSSVLVPYAPWFTATTRTEYVH